MKFLSILVLAVLATGCGRGEPVGTLEFPLEGARVYRGVSGEPRFGMAAWDGTLQGLSASCPSLSVKVVIEPERSGTFVRLSDVIIFTRNGFGMPSYTASAAILIVRTEEQKLLWEEYLRLSSTPRDVFPPEI